MASATLTSKGRSTIPLRVRKVLGLDAGDRVEFVEIDQGKFAIVAATRSVRELEGIVPKQAPEASFGRGNERRNRPPRG
jgi:antitoxin PrlF